jgi:hypothetical protein
VHYAERTSVLDATPCENGRWRVDIQFENGGEATINAGFLVDAGGRTAALADYVGAKATAFSDYPDTVALYSHFDGVA